MSLRSTGAALVCFRKADSTRKRAVCLLALDESARMRKRRRLQWWSRKLMARVPVLTSSNGVIGAPPILYGRASNYTLDHERPLSPEHYYDMFRFCREDIPRLVLAWQWFARAQARGTRTAHATATSRERARRTRRSTRTRAIS